MTPPPVRFFSFRPGAPMPHQPHPAVHPEADPLCVPHIDALRMGYQMDSPLGWALTRTPDGMRVGWLREPPRALRSWRPVIDWQEPDELGNVYHPEGPAILDGFPVELVEHARKIIVPGRGLQFANVKEARPGLIEIISGWVFDSDPGWGLRVGWPSGVPMPDGLAEVPHAYFRPWYAAPFPTVFRIDRIGAVVRFPRGAPMAAFVPLPDSVREANGGDGRELAEGVAEWPPELAQRVAEVSDRIYSRRGGYSATAHRVDRTPFYPGAFVRRERAARGLDRQVTA